MERERVHLTDDEARIGHRLLDLLAAVCPGDITTVGQARTLARSIRDRLQAIEDMHGRLAAAARVAPSSQGTKRPAYRPSADGVTTFIVPAGIGDFAWMAGKLVALAAKWGEPIRIKVAGDQPQRSKEFIELLDGLEFGGYVDGVLSQDVMQSVRLNPNPPTLEELKGMEAYLSINDHIEHGLRVEDWYPEVEGAPLLELNTPAKSVARAVELIGEKSGRLIGIYPASYNAIRDTGFWSEDAWGRVADALLRDGPCTFVVFGAVYDKDLASAVASRLRAQGANISECVGLSFSVAVEVLSRLDLLLAYPSGLPIVAALIQTPVIWWLPQSMPNEAGGGNVRDVTGWIPQSSLDDGLIETRPYETPSKAIEAIRASRPYLLSRPKAGAAGA